MTSTVGKKRLRDLSGQIFGLWTVLRFTEKRGKVPYWLCRCACGHEVELCGWNLTSGKSTGCRECKQPPEDMCGQVFGRLTVTAHAERYVHESGTLSRCVCRCECGNEVTVFAQALKSGATQSCGCLHREISSNQLTGQKFGRLTALSPHHTAEKGGHIYWLCACECGKEKVVKGAHLITGNVRSCGCITATRGGKSQTKEFKAYYAAVRRELEIGLDSQWTPEMEIALTKLQPFCVLCDKPATDTDHVRPLAHGFGLVPGNAVRLCSHCNSVKSDRCLVDMPLDMGEKLIAAAERFYRYWHSPLRM